MKKASLFVFLMVVGTTISTVYAANGFCKRCQEIEEERRKNPPREYEYYEDYLDEQKNGPDAARKTNRQRMRAEDRQNHYDGSISRRPKAK